MKTPMMRRGFAVAAALVAMAAAACQPIPETTAEAAVQTPTSTDCAARGGTMQPVGRAQTMQCVVRYADAKKPCTSGEQCAGDCRIEDTPFPMEGVSASGRCQADSRPFGCYARVENGKATPALCVD